MLFVREPLGNKIVGQTIYICFVNEVNVNANYILGTFFPFQFKTFADTGENGFSVLHALQGGSNGFNQFGAFLRSE